MNPQNPLNPEDQNEQLTPQTPNTTIPPPQVGEPPTPVAATFNTANDQPQANKASTKKRNILIASGVIFVLIVIALIPTGNNAKDSNAPVAKNPATSNPQSDLLTFRGSLFSVEYPNNFSFEDVTPSNAKNTQLVSFTPHDGGEIYMVAGNEPSASPTASKNVADYSMLFYANGTVTDKKLENVTVSGIDGVKVTWRGSKPSNDKEFSLGTYVAVIKNNTVFALTITYDEGDNAFEKQLPDIIKSFKISE